MFVDASALVALISSESEADRVSDALIANPDAFTSPLAVLETALALARPDKWNLPIVEIESLVATILRERGIVLRDVADHEACASLALSAADRYRAGRRGLNLADCMHYAVARHYKVPMLATANEFRQTDLDVVD